MNIKICDYCDKELKEKTSCNFIVAGIIYKLHINCAHEAKRKAAEQIKKLNQVYYEN